MIKNPDKPLPPPKASILPWRRRQQKVIEAEVARMVDERYKIVGEHMNDLNANLASLDTMIKTTASRLEVHEEATIVRISELVDKLNFTKGETEVTIEGVAASLDDRVAMLEHRVEDLEI